VKGRENTRRHFLSAFRICQIATDTASHKTVAAPRTIHARSLVINCETTNPKTTNPMLPIDAPAASTLAVLLPRAAPSNPSDSFFSFSCFSDEGCACWKNRRER